MVYHKQMMQVFADFKKCFWTANTSNSWYCGILIVNANGWDCGQFVENIGANVHVI
jgi:hypothetical protein